MILYYADDGSVYYAVYDVDVFKFIHTTNIILNTFQIDEVDPTNKELCADLKRTEFKFNENGERKYKIISDKLYAVDGWQEKILI